MADGLRLLTTRKFGTFWFASLLSSIGTWAQQVAEPWLLLSLGASAFVIGLDSFAMNAPVLVLTLAGGALADRANRRRVIAVCQSIQLLCPAAVVVLLVTHAIAPWMIVALSVVVGVTDALSMPSFQSIVPTIVPRSQIGQGLALNATQFNLSRILGPSIAGVLMASLGATACFVLSAASYVPFIGVALWVLPRWVPTPAKVGSSPARRPLEGLRVLLHQPPLRSALLTVLATNTFCAQIVTFSPALVKDVFHGDATRFSVSLSAFGVGGLVGAGVLLSLSARVDRGRLSRWCALVSGGGLVAIALNPWFAALPPLLVLVGASLTMTNTAANVVLQTSANPKSLGRAVSLSLLALRGGLSIGALITGALAHNLGVGRALLIDGVVAVVLQAAIGIVCTPRPRLGPVE